MINWLCRFQIHIVSRNTQQAEPDLNSIRLRNVSCNLARKWYLYQTDLKDDFSSCKNKNLT